MVTKKQKEKAEERLNDVFTEPKLQKIKEKSQEHAKEIAQVISATTLSAKEPKSLTKFKQQVEKDMDDLGIITEPQKDAIMAEIVNSDAYQQAVAKKISLEQLSDILVEGLYAEKAIIDKGEIVDRVPDHKTRLDYYKEAKRDLGLDKREDENPNGEVKIVMFSPPIIKDN